MNAPAEYQPPAEYDADRMDEVEACWALLKLKRWERIAERADELESQPDAASFEIRSRITSLRRRYREGVGVAPDQRAALRQWLSSFLPGDR